MLPKFSNRLEREILPLPVHLTPQPLPPLENFLLAPMSVDAVICHWGEQCSI